MSQYGFLNQGSYDTSGNALDFANLSVDPNQEYGAYRNELKTEADMLDAADNGPSRGFSGGLANQAGAAAKRAVASRQTGFQQNLQQQLGNLNLDANNQSFGYSEGVTGVNQNAAEYGANAALWQAMNPTASYTVPGASGGGSTPVKPQNAVSIGAMPPTPQVPYNRTGPETPGRPVPVIKQPIVGGRGHIT